MAATESVEGFVLVNLNGSFSGVLILQVRVVHHGRYDATQFCSVAIIFIPACP